MLNYVSPSKLHRQAIDSVVGASKPQYKGVEIIMSLYAEYLTEIETRKGEGLSPKPIDNGDLVAELIEQIKDTGHEHRDASLNFFIYNTLPGTTSAGVVKGGSA